MDRDRAESLVRLGAETRSIVQTDTAVCFFVKGPPPRVGVLGGPGDFQGAHDDLSGALLCPTTPANAAALRRMLPWLRPVPLGLRTSAGFGDRLGLATPGHVRALRRLAGRPGDVAPVFAQQSVRENTRTGRTPQQVLDDATWGLLREGWQGAWGADADHVKLIADLEPFAAAGYSMYTVDPGDHVDDSVSSASPTHTRAAFDALPWPELEDTAGDMERRHVGRAHDLGGFVVELDRETLWRAAAKYGRAVAHTARIYRQIAERLGERPFELEVSVDETETPTSVKEHVFVAVELERLGVRWVSLAPRFVGRFEKGVDYIGDLETFAQELARHAAVARALGPYKLSLHSGSDKFSIYPIAARLLAGGAAGRSPLAHLKTAGTSYLEALRAIAQAEPGLFREVLALGRERYETDRRSYHVSGSLASVPVPEGLRDADLPGLLGQFAVRQALHVTYGSALDHFGDRLRRTIERHEEAYHALLEEHFERHLAAFVG